MLNRHWCRLSSSAHRSKQSPARERAKPSWSNYVKKPLKPQHLQGLSAETITRTISTPALHGKRQVQCKAKCCTLRTCSVSPPLLCPHRSGPLAAARQPKANRRLTQVRVWKKDIASYLGPLSRWGVKYSLIKYSLAKTTAEVMIQAKLLLSACLWVFVVFGWFLGVFFISFPDCGSLQMQRALHRQELL